jgi:uncharacterized protein (TIGR03382 family)
VSPTSQDLLDDPPATGVPAPASALLLAAALVPLLRRRRACIPLGNTLQGRNS